MASRVIGFRKSGECRLKEFKNLLSDVTLPCSDIQQIWARIFNDYVIQYYGWLALWNMSEECCLKYDLVHPWTVIVKVENYNWDTMSAIITVVAVQDDIILPPEIEVPVLDLYPLRDQDYNEENLNIMADWLDKYRFFFKYLWYPWDNKPDVSVQTWCESHLESRLQIQCDIHNQMINKNLIQYFNTLMDETKEVDAELTEIQTKGLSSLQMVDAIHYCIRRKVLKLELNFFEEPHLRDDLLLLRIKDHSVDTGGGNTIKLIWQGGRVHDFMQTLQLVKSIVGDESNITIVSSLQEALGYSVISGRILLTPGSYFLKSLKLRQAGCIVEGVGEAGTIKICAARSEKKKGVLFESIANLEIRNLTISQFEGAALKVSEGTLKLHNCRITSEKSSGTRGIIVLAGCSLVLENCEITGYGVGITLQNDAKAIISNTLIRDCVTGIKLNDETELSFDKVEISRCSECALRLHTANLEATFPVHGDLDLLSALASEVTFDVNSLLLAQNKTCDVMICKNPDYFSFRCCGSDISDDSTVILIDADSS